MSPSQHTLENPSHTGAKAACPGAKRATRNLLRGGAPTTVPNVTPQQQAIRRLEHGKKQLHPTEKGHKTEIIGVSYPFKWNKLLKSKASANDLW
mmetsp:Transcript_10429/g.25120  ORF Transcript_10429/g.25120 Transcript_10429/m.25120 type:complete len:94 (+) Transcript_10429:159-440(+)